jgi:hypothetical protein
LKAVLGQCDIFAFLFVSAIALDPFDAYESAQLKQRVYESGYTCAAKCPTSQQYGGQGTTVLTIDMTRTSGTFPIKYRLYGDPDELFIEYEGRRIFEASRRKGSDSASVTFAGASTLIKMTIHSANPGSKWDVDVGCPM